MTSLSKDIEMTVPRRILLVLAVACACLVLPQVAAAATSEQVLADWRADGTIDGDYTLAELRAADSQINPQEREYTFWDDAYADAVRRLNNPDADEGPKPPPTVPPQDFDGDGVIGANDIATAKLRTKALREKLRKCASGNAADRPADCPDGPADGPRVEPLDEDDAAVSTKNDDDGGLGWLAALLFAIPAAIIGIGAWRMQRGRRASATRDDDLDVPPASSFSRDDA